MPYEASSVASKIQVAFSIQKLNFIFICRYNVPPVHLMR